MTPTRCCPNSRSFKWIREHCWFNNVCDSQCPPCPPYLGLLSVTTFMMKNQWFSGFLEGPAPSESLGSLIYAWWHWQLEKFAELRKQYMTFILQLKCLKHIFCMSAESFGLTRTSPTEKLSFKLWSATTPWGPRLLEVARLPVPGPGWAAEADRLHRHPLGRQPSSRPGIVHDRLRLWFPPCAASCSHRPSHRRSSKGTKPEGSIHCNTVPRYPLFPIILHAKPVSIKKNSKYVIVRFKMWNLS